jgi:DNA polymerase III sliding clamp (beta) subunit (PCNA family)
VIPSTNTLRVTVDSDALGEALARVSSVDSKLASVVMEIVDEEIALRVTSEGNEATDRVECSVVGKPFGDIGLNARYMREALRQLGGEVEIRLTDNLSPITVRRNNQNDAAVAVVMPMRV